MPTPPGKVSAYLDVNASGRQVIDQAFLRLSEADILALGLPPLKDVKRKAEAVYPRDEGLRQAAIDDYRVKVAVLSLGAQLKPIQIQQRTGINVRTICNWLRRGKSPYAFGRLQSISTYDSPLEGSEDFATYLGFALSTRGEHKGEEVIVASKDRELTDEFEAVVGRLWSAKCSESKSGGTVYKHISSKSAWEYLKTITNDYTTLPWEHLHTDIERRNFLRAYLSSHSSILQPRVDSDTGKIKRKATVEIQKKVVNDAQLGFLQDLRILLLKQGFSSTLQSSKDGYYCVSIVDQDDLRQLLKDKGYFLQEERKKELRQALDTTDKLFRVAKRYTRSDYHRFMSALEICGDVVEAAKQTGIRVESALDWQKGNTLPRAVLWEREIFALEKARRPDEIGYAFRNISPVPSEARQLAGKHSMDELVVMGFRKRIDDLIDNWPGYKFRCEIAHLMIKRHAQRKNLEFEFVRNAVLDMMGRKDQKIRKEFEEFHPMSSEKVDWNE